MAQRPEGRVNAVSQRRIGELEDGKRIKSENTSVPRKSTPCLGGGQEGRGVADLTWREEIASKQGKLFSGDVARTPKHG